MDESRALARFACGLEYDRLPPAVVDKAKELILDQVGLMMGVATLPWSRVIYDYVCDWGECRAEATVAHYGLRTKVENAVFANASFGHGFEMDDLYVYGSSHPGCIVVPTALAMAEREGASGRDMIAAVVAGYEVMGRINSAITPSCALRGFHAPTSVTGPFGAAAAAGRLLGLDDELMLHALSIAGSHAGGVTEYDQGGGSVKRMHAGMAAHGGVRSALLAQKGLTGPGTILEGKHGFIQAFSDEKKLHELTDGLGEDFRVVMGTGIKYYCACGPIHAGIDAMKALLAEHGFAARDIARITFGTNRRSVSHVEAKPTDILAAQFSAAFSLALTVLRGGNGFQDYTEQTLRDPAILALTDRVDLEIDPEVDKAYPGNRGARVTVQLTDGRRLACKVDHCKGTPQNPLTKAEFEGKFRSVASAVADAARVERVLQLVGTLERQSGVAELVGQMCSR